jgi:hypothetical protein
MALAPLSMVGAVAGRNTGLQHQWLGPERQADKLFGAVGQFCCNRHGAGAPGFKVTLLRSPQHRALSARRKTNNAAHEFYDAGVTFTMKSMKDMKGECSTRAFAFSLHV